MLAFPECFYCASCVLRALSRIREEEWGRSSDRTYIRVQFGGSCLKRQTRSRGERGRKSFYCPLPLTPPPSSPANNTNQSVRQTAAYKLESIPIVSLHFSKNSRTPIKPPGVRSRDRYALSSFFGRCLFELFTFSHPGKGKGFFHR